MECKIKNDIGTVYITEDVMLRVAGYAALECYGIVAMSSKRAKDGIAQWLGRENLTKGVQLRMADDMLDVGSFYYRRVWHLHRRGVQGDRGNGQVQAGKYDGYQNPPREHLG